MTHKKLVWPSIAMALCLAAGMAWGGETVDINTASAEQLQAVHGIGEKTAAMIVAYRSEHGAFKSIDELQNIKGIGSKSLEKFKHELTAGPAYKD